MEEEYQKLLGSKISIPYDMLESFSDGAKHNNVKVDWTYLSYVDSVECTPCHMSGINLWRVIEKAFADRGEKLSVVLVFCPKRRILDEVKKNYRLSNCMYGVYLDTSAVLIKYNPQLPSDKRMHCVLLDSCGKVVLIGDPTHNKNVETLLYNYLDSVTQVCNN